LEFPATALGCHDLLTLGLAGHCRDDRIYFAVAFLLTSREEGSHIGEVALAGAEGDVIAVDELGDLRMPTSQFTWGGSMNRSSFNRQRTLAQSQPRLICAPLVCAYPPEFQFCHL